MNYEIVLGEEALRFIRNDLPINLIDAFEHNLNMLRQSPSYISERTPFPISHPGQVFYFVIHDNDRHYHFAVYFYYSDNEHDIKIYDIELFEN